MWNNNCSFKIIIRQSDGCFYLFKFDSLPVFSYFFSCSSIVIGNSIKFFRISFGYKFTNKMFFFLSCQKLKTNFDNITIQIHHVVVSIVATNIEFVCLAKNSKGNSFQNTRFPTSYLSKNTENTSF